jgi:hypothetical protein
MRFLLASLKTCSTVFLKIVPKAMHIKLLRLSFSLLLLMAGFRNNFQALSKQLLVSQAAIGKLEQAY